MTERQYAINFSQTLDISYLTPRVYELLLRVDYQNARFTRKRIYFSCNHPGTNRQFMDRKDMLKGFGIDAVHKLDRKSTRLNSSHGYISYAVFCLKKKNTKKTVHLTYYK